MRSTHPKLLRRYFAGIAEHTFLTQLGVADPPLLDYVSDLLTRFIRSEAVYQLRSLSGKPLRAVAEMLAEAEERVGIARREVHRHIGDYTLFWTGVYPEAVDRLRTDAQQDQLVDYRAEGKKAYWIASTIDTDQAESAPGAVLERLSQQFELVAYGLREVRRQWETGDETEPPRPFLIN
jgi:hypothetical protein